MARPFLTARWTDLILAQYAVDDDLLIPRLAPGLELDRFQGRAFVSLVAFNFRETRVRGVRWPLHVNFPEVNLRFYVREMDTNRRGVMFVREWVPRRAIAWIARALYNEPYSVARMRATRTETPGRVEVVHSWRARGAEGLVRAVARGSTHLPEPGTLEHWFKEHEWGYGVTRARSGRVSRRLTYRVEHPVWHVYDDATVSVNVDFASLYGQQWGDLTGRAPDSTVFAVGSEVTVSPLVV